MTRDVHRHQQQKRQPIGGIGQAHPDPHIDRGSHDHDEKAQDEFGELRQGPGIPMTASHRIEHGDPGRGDDADQEHQAPIHIQQLVGHAQRAFGDGIGARNHRTAPPAGSAASLIG
jgi:hypothetical protein